MPQSQLLHCAIMQGYKHYNGIHFIRLTNWCKLVQTSFQREQCYVCWKKWGYFYSSFSISFFPINFCTFIHNNIPILESIFKLKVGFLQGFLPFSISFLEDPKTKQKLQMGTFSMEKNIEEIKSKQNSNLRSTKEFISF